MTNTRRKAGVIATGLAALAGLGLMPGNAQAQVSGSAEYIQAKHNENSYGRLMAFYGLPHDVSGFSFMEFYKGGNGYFGKTSLSKEVSKGIGPKAEIAHINEPLSRVGLGLTAKIPYMPEGVYGKVGLLPLWVDKNGNAVHNKTMLQYSFGGVSLPFGFKLSSFGDWNLSAPEGIQWSYGEGELTRDFGNVKVGLNPVLLNDGDATPRLENRFIVGVKF